MIKMKSTPLLTGALVGAILMGDYQPKAKADPQPEVIGIDDCIIFAAGCVMFAAGWSCWRNGWQRIWNGGTNTTVMITPPFEPPTGDDGGGLDLVSKPKLRLNAAYAYAVTNSVYTNMVTFIEQATEDLVNWTNRFGFSVWESPTARLMLVSDPMGVPLWTNLAARGADGRSTNYCPFLTETPKQHEFFRLLSQ